MDKYNVPLVFAVKHKDERIRMASRSGGIFTALSDYVLDRNGVVYGCILTDDLLAKHIRATSKEERDRMRGSKYIQSSLGNVFELVEDDLKANKQVLFSGTSCQVAGLQLFLGQEYSNLICVDIVCHGVPSPLIWVNYIKWQEERANSQIDNVDFRNKREFGWAAHVESLYMKNNSRVDSDVFKELFYGHDILRPCCHRCPYKSIMHPGNITIADYWGIQNAAPGFDDNKGVSLVLVNDELGNNMFNAVNDSLDYKECDIEKSLQPPLKAPFPFPDNRYQFWKDFYMQNFDYLAKKYTNFGFINKSKQFAIRLAHKLLRR
ncbi:Coenzyme F420 hydrogenase/dehydrogenase, beta subunit C-terminal domain [Ruminococcus albus]|uniref:Coenzyme F420 hydrogenase/dehydrogenase, beta subunit C-terminal domain n=1 Tax=Ruminococcus albus TaxID=1264 RepID=UPI001FA78193|nr:Coenzyme F420 hydrogenase/dehydrogenase, beta subunit C-terminal domain [Ruminococcus albus]